jgi:hypoxanthine phosphoribosyltransferase
MPRITESLHAGIIFPTDLIDKRVDAMAEQVLEDFDENILLVGLLTGGSRVLHDLISVIGVKKPESNLEYEYMRTVNYGPSADAKGPRITSDLPPHVEIKDREVLIVDDMIDSGGSTNLTEKHVKDLGATRVLRAALLYRTVKIIGEIEEENLEVIDNDESRPEICGLDYDDIFFVAGRGLNGPESGRGGGRAWPFIAKCAFQPDKVINLRF